MNPTPMWSGLSNDEFRAIAQKGQGEIFFFSRYLYRPFTTYLTRLYLRVRISPNAVTVHSILAALVAGGAVLWPSPTTFLVGAAGLQAYFFLDHVDGEVARIQAWENSRAPAGDGAFMDFWAHFHSVNLVFGALGVGLALKYDQVVWAVVGLLCDNCLGNFPKLTLGRTLWSMYEQDASVVTAAGFQGVLRVVTDSDSTRLFRGQLTFPKRAFLAARELVFFPGCLIALSVVLLADAGKAFLGGSFDTLITRGYLVAFLAVALISKLRRTLISAGQLRELEESKAKKARESATP